MPLVSVLLPTHARNKSGLLSKAISSVLAQDFSDFELFVIDDGSSDGSVETIQEFCNLDKRVRHIRFEENVGLPALTAAHALKQSSGKYIAWQFDDCTWMSNHLIDLVEAAQKAKIKSVQSTDLQEALRENPILRIGLKGKTIADYVADKPNS